MLIEWTLLRYTRYRQRRLRISLEHYPEYLLKDMGLRIEGSRVVSDRPEQIEKPMLHDSSETEGHPKARGLSELKSPA